MRLAFAACLLAACAGSAASAPRDAAPSRPAPSSAARDASTPLEPVARTEPASSAAPPLPPASASTSIGSPSNGRLEGGVPLPLGGAGFRFNERRDPSARHATVEVIGAIMRAAARVRERFADSELVVNDLSLPQGGRIAHHDSHRAGRDADILFYLRGDDGAVTPPVGAPIDPDGVGFDFKDLSVPEDDLRVHFDAQRTWLLVAALLEDREAEVQRIFVVEHLRDALLREAQRAGAAAALRERFSDVACQPGYPHDDHLHVRWFCSLEDLEHGCEDLPPLYPWREAALRAAGSEPRVAKRTRAVDPAPVTTLEQAERAVARQKPHADVLAFLARRKRWERQPHPGRAYCP
jgi:penicillin-insensitive murein DD-endopeptidase